MEMRDAGLLMNLAFGYIRLFLIKQDVFLFDKNE